MVHITYWRDGFRLTAKGHAGAGAPGQDVVCAGVSALALTLGANVADLCLQENACQPALCFQPGNACIACVPKKGMEPVVMLIFDTVCQGFALLQTLYPEHVKFEMRNAK